MKTLFSRIKNFARDNGGMEALQTVLITAVAAMVMVGAVKMGQKGVDAGGEGVNKVITQAQADGGDTEGGDADSE